jgi:uncharacterized Ntn-hydrolase superfamily protein
VVGVSSTQASVEVSYGPLGLALMKGGKTPRQALKSLLAADPMPEVRQVAMLDTRGRVAVHTGHRCMPEAGHESGPGFSAQANIMRNRTVWGAMARSFSGSSGSLAERLMLALESAEEEGGDLRGRQSAAILVVKLEGSSTPWHDRLVDLRVEDHPQPLVEMRRILRIHGAFAHANEGDLLMEKGENRKAMEEYRRSAELAPENPELRFWQAVTLLNHGELEEGRSLLRSVFKANKDLRVLLERLPAVGMLKADEETMRQLLEP